ncbi:hypothetical protein BGX31_008246 [Mortierella sp. GBA43]|nr:hypothetical protein BGX31_008246 [Mortierella sp. GBA43]
MPPSPDPTHESTAEQSTPPLECDSSTLQAGSNSPDDLSNTGQDCTSEDQAEISHDTSESNVGHSRPRNTKRKAATIHGNPDSEPEDEAEDDIDDIPLPQANIQADAKARKKEKQWKRKQRKKAKKDQWMQAAGLADKSNKEVS